MRANRAFELIVSRAGHGPAFLADPKRSDRVEVVSIEDSELMLYWELPPRQAAKLVRRLREDLASLEAEEFIAIWEGADGLGDGP